MANNKKILKIYVVICIVIILSAAAVGYIKRQAATPPGGAIQQIQEQAESNPQVKGYYVYECGKVREMSKRNTSRVKQECLNSIGKNLT